jgi:TM2 domain-containing membrane protein YozV
MVIMPIMGLFTSILISSILQRPLFPVHVYNDGVETHLFTFDRMLKRKGFIPLSDISAVQVVKYVDTKTPEYKVKTIQMSFLTSRKSSYWIGQRDEGDIKRAIEYIRKEWPRVEIKEMAISSATGKRVDAAVPVPTSPGKARKISVPASRSADASSPVQRSTYQTPTSAPSSMTFCPSCGGGVVSGSRFCPACGHQFGPSVMTGGYPQAAKSANVALLLGLLPGLIGLLGLGQFYVRKYAKGAFLLIIGIMFAGLGMGSLLLLGDPKYAGDAAAMVMTIFFNLLFVMLLVYSVVDARRSAMKFNLGTR